MTFRFIRFRRNGFLRVQKENPQTEVQSVGAFAGKDVEISWKLSTTRTRTRIGHAATEVAGKATSRVGGGEVHLQLA
jgi:hypothetical protein